MQYPTKLHRRGLLVRGAAVVGVAALGGVVRPAVAAADAGAPVRIFFPGAVPYFAAQWEGMQEEARLQNVPIEAFYADWDPVIQVRQVESALSRGSRALCLCSVDNRALRVVPNLLQRHASATPVFTFTNSIGDAPDGRYPGIAGHVGRDEGELGRLLGQFVDKALPGKNARILLIEGAPGTTPQRLRSEGFLAVAAQHPGWKMVRRLTIPGWREDLVEAELNRILPLPIDVIATHWAGAATAAARVQQKRRLEPVPMVTLEFTKALKQDMLNGHVYYTTTHDVRGEGREVIRMVQQTLDNQPHAWFSRIGLTVVDRAMAAKLEAQW